MQVNRFHQSIAIALCIALTGCAATDHYSFIRYGQVPDPATHQLDPTAVPPLSDVLALNYAASVATILRCKFTGARVTREVSSSAQVILAALAGAGAAFGWGSEAIAALGLGSAGIPELQKIFDAKGRAQSYQDAVRLIEEAQIEYLSFNQTPSNTVLTQNGVTLFQRVTACIHVVEKTLAGNLPSVTDMQQATERMSTTGAVKTRVGTAPANLIPAAGPVQKLAPVVINNPVPPGLSKSDDVQTILQEARETLSELSDAEALNAYADLNPNSPPLSDAKEARVALTELFLDTTSISKANDIVTKLKNAKKKHP